jgi:hypothetical protein
VRVPNTVSLRFLEAEPIDGGEAETPPYADLSAQEIDQLIIKCRRAMHSHHRESLHRDPARAEAALAARESVQQILVDLWQVAPEAKRAKIEAILRRY